MEGPLLTVEEKMELDVLAYMRTVAIERNTYGRGVHRFHQAFLDYARLAGFMPRLCQPYRALRPHKRFVTQWPM